MARRIGLCLFLLFSLSLLSAQSKAIQSLRLDYVRTETAADGREASFSGNIFYARYPFLFWFTISSPEVQSMYVTADGAFLLEDGGKTATAFSESEAALRQTCTDFLTWFKRDFGLAEAGYAPVACEADGGKIVSRWQYGKDDEHIIETIAVRTDARGVFEELQMFGADGSLITRTETAGVQKSGAYFFPTKIVSETYSEGALVVTTTLQFSGVAFNLPKEDMPGFVSAEKNGSAVQGTGLERLVMSSARGMVQKSSGVRAPVASVFRTSTPSVLAGAGFLFYKKYITKQDMSACPYEPSCSQYMVQAVQRKGLVGLIQGLERKRRCTTEEHSRGLYPTTASGKHYDPLGAE